MGNAMNMGKQIKGGYLLRYKRGWLWRSWREEWVVLYEDSTLAWFKDKGTRCPRGLVQVNEAPELVAVSEWTLQIPCRPRLPPDCQVKQLIALGSKKKRGKVHWLLAQSEDEVNDWMTAISNTLPPPPHLTIETAKNHNIAIFHNGSLRNTYPTTPRLRRLLSITSSTASESAGETTGRPTTGTAEHSRDDYTSGTVMGAALNWGHGWGWSQVLWGNHGGVCAGHTATVYATEMSGNPYAHLGDDYGTTSGTGFDDVDYSMDCSGDFVF